LQRDLGRDPEEEARLKQTEDEQKLASVNKDFGPYPPEALQIRIPDTRPVLPQQQGGQK